MIAPLPLRVPRPRKFVAAFAFVVAAASLPLTNAALAQSGNQGPAQRPPVVLDERAEDERRSGRKNRRERRSQERRRGAEPGRAGPRTSRQRGAPRKGRGGGQSGPPFCRSGAGHPVFGMQWCREKGFAAPRRYRSLYPRDRYERGRRGGEYQRDRRHEGQDRRQRRPGRLGDILLGRVLPGHPEQGRLRQRRDPRLTEPQLGDLLGRRVLDRLKRRGRRLGMDSALSGRWLERRGAQVLRVTAGSQTLVELIDSDRDGRADRALLARQVGRR